MGRQWQLLDRSSERETVQSALDAKDVSGIVLVGPAGVGKTTLARTVSSAMAPEVYWAACTQSSQNIPLGVFAPWLTPSATRDPLTLMLAARQSLLTRDDAIIGVDDAHLLDQLSATLLLQMAIERSARIVATVRSDERVPDAVTSLWKDGYLRRLDLHPLTKPQSIALVETVLGGTLEGLSADVMWESSGGNPLYLRHMVEGALEAGTLTEFRGVWQLRGATVVSSGLATLLDGRLAEAGESAMSAVKYLALYEPLAIDTLSRLAGAQAVDDAEFRGLIRVVEDGSVVNARISHPLYGDVVRRRIGAASARALRGEIVGVLGQQQPATAADRIRMAELYMGSDQEPDGALLVAAAKDAISLANLPLGERFARVAFDQGDGLRSGALLSRSLLWQGRPAEADEILTRFDPDDLDELQLVQWGVPRLSILFWSLGYVDQAHEVLALLDSRVTHPALALVVDATRSAMAVHENHIEAGLATAMKVLAQPDAPEQAVDFAAFGAGLAMPVAGRGGEFDAIAARARAIQKPTDGMVRIMIRYGDVLALTHTGQLERAAARVAEYAQFSSAGQFLGWAIAKIMAGVVATHRGRFPDAIASFEQALAALNAEKNVPWHLPARIIFARAHAALGHIPEAEQILLDTNEHTGPHMLLHEPQLILTKAWVAAARGADRTAVDLAQEAAALARRSGQFAIEAEALHHAVRFGDRRVVTARLTMLAAQIDGDVAGLFALHSAATAASDPAALDAVSAQFEDAGLLLSAADSAAQAAALYDAAKLRRQGALSAARAVELAHRCGGALTRAIRSATKPLPLSARELEIALMVADGLSNKEIAGRLVVSMRTVEGHIYRACTKVDVSDREALGVLARAHLTGRS
ncbi:MAG: LuxR C-terminal-related transcriptional regulator [Mycobacterium sp.]